MDWATLASLLAAIGTLLVAAITFYNITALRTQARIMERQALLQRSVVYPFVEIVGTEVKRNSLRTKLKNKGGGPAFRIGTLTSFIPLKPDGSQYDLVTHLHDHDRESYPSEMVVFLKSADGRSKLHPQETQEFKAELLFWLTPFKTPSSYPWMDLLRGKSGYGGRGCSFDELKKLMASNGVNFAALIMDLVYTDMTESILETEPICRVVMDLNRHRSIEDAINDKIIFHQINMALEESEWTPWDSYRNRKSRRYFLEGFGPRFKE